MRDEYLRQKQSFGSNEMKALRERVSKSIRDDLDKKKDICNSFRVDSII